jgi:peptidoglycan/xylan/chitin deacetylase (PgdA/CDA1 family)
MRIVSFCFDDGFARSARQVRAIFEARGLRACFAVLAAPELAEDPYIRAAPIAGWPVWREVLDAGHEVHPHGYAHEHLGRIAVDAARESVERTLAIFAAELPAFEASQAVFHLAYLAAPQPVTNWLGERLLGVRMRTETDGWNDLRGLQRGGVVSCVTFGPDDTETRLSRRLETFLAGPPGWLVIVLHGLDGEGWGSLAYEALERTLDTLLGQAVEIAPPGAVLRRYLGETSIVRAPDASAQT